jgi:hypothetical protein
MRDVLILLFLMVLLGIAGVRAAGDKTPDTRDPEFSMGRLISWRRS